MIEKSLARGLLDVARRIRTGEISFRDDELVDEATHALAAAQPAAEPVALLKSGPVCYADAQSILEYRLPMVGSHLPGVRDVGLWTTDQMRAYAQATADAWAEKLDAARAQPAAEPVAWQFRWTNPGNQPDQNPEWEPIVPNWNQTMQEKITELEHYRYSGKPCYEVRVLVVGSKT